MPVKTLQNPELCDTELDGECEIMYAYIINSNQHVCQVSGIESSIKVARISMKHKVHENSSKPVPQIYEEVNLIVLAK